MNSTPIHEISESNVKILTLAIKGLRSKEIGRELNMTEEAVAQRLSRLSERFGAQSQIALGAKALLHPQIAKALKQSYSQSRRSAA